MKNYLSKINNNALTSPWGLSKGLSSFFDDFFSDWTAPSTSLSRWTPETDLVETATDYQLSVDLPGISLEDIDVSIKDGVLSISGERKTEEETNGKHYYRMERSYGKFVRSFKVPDDTTEESIKAIHKNGVLSITIPKPIKAEAEDTRKRINVRSEE